MSMTPQGQALRDAITPIEQAVLVLGADLLSEITLMNDLNTLKANIAMFDKHLANYLANGNANSAVTPATPTVA